MKQNIHILTLFIALLFLSENNATAQINTYPVNQTVTVMSGAFTLDLDSDSNDDYAFEIFQLAGDLRAARVISLGNSQVMDGSTFGYPDALSLDDNVTVPYSSGNAVLGTDLGGGGLFAGAGLKYLGLNLDISGESHLGWISLEVSATNDTIVLHDIGYNTTPSENITAGLTFTSSVYEASIIDFEIYPNPCVNTVSIDWPNSTGVNYSISDLTGKLILSGAIIKSIDLSALASGSYILSITEGQKVGRKKFIKD